MTTVSREIIEYALDDTDAELREQYSGRAMYGRTCFGIVGDLRTYSQFLLGIGTGGYDGDGDPDLADELSRVVTSDSMGLSTIYYFPGYEVAA